MGIEDARFEAYLEAVRRSRWFILATVILSSLILCHVYLERVSLQTAALQGVIAHRIKNQTEETLRDMEKKLEGEVDECVKQKIAIPKDLDVRLEAFAENKFTYIVTQNELNNTRLEKRSLPFLGLEIPSDDYLPIMSVMLAIFAVGVWLNIRSIWASLPSAGQKGRKEFVQLARLYFTFTGALDLKLQNHVAAVVQYCALWLPFAVLTLAGLLDLWPLIHPDPDFYLGPASILAVRVIILLAVWLTVALCALASTSLVRRVDSIID